jgi:hypothetical protein
MPDHFRELAEGLRNATGELVQASQHIASAGQHMNHAIDAMLAAHNEHSDLTETVTRLEALAMEQGAEIRALRDDLRKNRDDNPEDD